ncbi:uncharacterized protein LOC121249541 [Juglans microcarpa x Juglans regia]|uniref:uncharacterized protein LOC121249541 n=1 Tax=Juglans microcarpa x Juglans regia TaxID=2249226 RepID=UPI001B7E23D2|nr:uncharacterized protein LOC121249541 [Juglans microcarpa x Juglans regia]
MASPLRGFRNPLPWFASTLAPLLISAGFLGFGFSSLLLISTVWVLPFVYFTFSKHRPVVEAESQEVFGSDQASSTQMEDVVSKLEPAESETQTQKREAQESASEIYEQYALSESECLYHLSTSEGSEVEWPFREDVDQISLDYSDGSISDEESLIEIALPSGQYVGHNEEKTKDNKQQIKVSDFSQESIFQPHTYCLMELLSEINNEMNEEDNMIEIDISMGSIKCSRFEIEA